MEGETVGKRNLGVLISPDSGQTTAYSLGSVEDRGVMFVGPGVDVYEGMIVGEHSRDNDLTVNVTKRKTNDKYCFIIQRFNSCFKKTSSI